MRAEILAPAGSFDAVRAAVLNGADAVYFGTGNFNARRNASNFDGDELKKAIDFCHLHSVRCHITLNTLVSDSEIDELIKTVECVCDLCADALILQDLGVAEIVHEMCPDMPMHASTQLSTGTLEGLKQLKQLGFTRAVLPRELSFDEIKYLAENSPVELEMFIHGALCMSVSGQCLMSAMLGSRSGNRGLCAQPCRLPFTIHGGTGHDLSLKDLSLIDNIGELARLGVMSFKIEGRMKRPEYVAAAVTACRESLDGVYSDVRKDELKSLFSRSSFTKGYFENTLGRSMFGAREKENVTSATNQLLKKYAHTFEKEKPVHKVDFAFSAVLSEKLSLSASSENENVFVMSDTVCERAVNRPLTQEIVTAQLEKCGGTVFEADSIECDIDENVSVPMSAVNSLRREALSRLDEILTKRKPLEINRFNPKFKPHLLTVTQTFAVFYEKDNIPLNVQADRVFLPLECDSTLFEKYNAGVIIPRGLFGNFDAVLEKVKACGAEYALCNTLDGVALAKAAGLEIIGGPFLNVFNSVSLSVLQNLGVAQTALSYEMTLTQLAHLGGEIKRGVVVYGRTPLMLTRNCPVKNAKTCAECKRLSSLTDRMGIEFPVRCNNGFSEILNSRPTYMADRLDEIKGADFIMLIFTDESKTECERILKSYKTREKPVGEFTRGLFYRGVE